MQILNYKVDGQTLTGVNIPDDLRRGTSNYLKLRFSILGNEWNCCKLIVQFNDSVGIAVKQNMVTVPDVFANRSIFKFKLYGFGKDNYRIVTNDVFVELGD